MLAVKFNLDSSSGNEFCDKGCGGGSPHDSTTMITTIVITITTTTIMTVTILGHVYFYPSFQEQAIGI